MPPTQEEVLQAMPEGGLFAGQAGQASTEQFGILQTAFRPCRILFSDQFKK